jgi:hypothetical protein
VKTKTPDFAKLVGTIHERVVRKLGPYGILVEHTEPDVKSRDSISEFTLKIPDQDKSKPGVYQELIVHFTWQDATQCHQDPKNLDCLPQAWARICADWAPALFDNAPPPPADAVDWRPDEALPEDFYAA